MEEAAFRTEDGVGLIVAITLHALLVAALLWQFAFTTPQMLTPERLTVSLATEVSLDSTAPDPVPESRAAIAPTLSEEPAPAPETAPDEAVSEVTPATTPPPTPSQTRSNTRTPARQTERSRPDRQSRPAPTPSRTPTRRGGSQIGDDFLAGSGGSTNTTETRIPANQIGRSARASLQQAINRQLQPHWSAPNGLDAELLVSTVSWRLNEDGSLRGSPSCRTDSSTINASNRPQAELHCDRAIRAVRQAAPFDLPDEYYEAWKNITSWRFDRRL